MKRLSIAALAAFFVLLGCENPASTSTAARAAVGPSPLTYYVSNNGNNNYPGTSAQPFKTITHALVKAGQANPTAGHRVVVSVAPGTYNTANSEIFPLIVPAHVEIAGDIQHSGNGTVPTKIVGSGLISGTSSSFATMMVNADDVIGGLWITTNNQVSSGQFAVVLNQGTGIQIAYCTIVRSTTGIYGADNVQATIHDTVLEENETGIRLLNLTPQDGSITELYRNSIRHNTSRGVYLSLSTGSIVPDLGGALIGYYFNPILGQTPIYGRGLNVLAWNGVQDLYIDSAAGTVGTFSLFTRNNSWSQIAGGGTSGGVIAFTYPQLSIDSANAVQAPNTPSPF